MHATGAILGSSWLVRQLESVYRLDNGLEVLHLVKVSLSLFRRFPQ